MLLSKNSATTSRLIALPTPNAVTLAILVPLTAFGTVEAILHLKKYFGRVLRKIISIVDPIVPTRKEIIDILLQTPIRLDQVEEHIREDAQTVVEGAERHIQWADPMHKQKTPLCVVFLHGWSACRQEGRPVVGDIAKSLGANLYEGRLPGHGRASKAAWTSGPGSSKSAPDGHALLNEAKPRDLCLSALDSLRVGLTLGDRVVLVGMSTGGVLATWLSSILLSDQVDDNADGNEETALRNRLVGLVLISPAYALGHPLYPILKHSFAAMRALPLVSRAVRKKMIELALGVHRHIPAMNDDHYRYATLSYPSAAVLHLMDLLYEMEIIDYASITLPTLMIGNPNDPVVNFRVKATNTFLKLGDAPNKILYCLTRGEHEHILACDFCSPSTVVEVTNVIQLFLNANGIVAPDHTLGYTENASGKQLVRNQSATKGLGSFASYRSFGELTRPLEF